MSSYDSRAELLLRDVPLAERGRLITLRETPALWTRLFGGPTPHFAKLYRIATRGSRGTVLRTVELGDRAPRTCAEWLVEWAVAVSDARGASPIAGSTRKGAARRSRRRAASKSAEAGQPTGGSNG